MTKNTLFCVLGDYFSPLCTPHHNIHFLLPEKERFLMHNS